MPGRFKDYVAMPKFNMYQSLHTTVIGPAGRPLEIQIRTEEMHRTAEYGVAAHWRYKEGGRGDETFDERLAWLRQMLEWQTELKDPREFMEALKIDLFEDEVFVFTPKGDVISLKRGSTPIDFAYAIHTEVGNHCVGAKVNGAIVPLGYELQMGDRVDVLTNKNASPSRDWLNIVKTSSAQIQDPQLLLQGEPRRRPAAGRDELAKVMRKHGLGIGSKSAEKALDAVAEEMNYAKGEDLLAEIGGGKLSAKLVGTRLLKRMSKDGDGGSDQQAKPEELPALPADDAAAARAASWGGGVVVKGIDDVLVRLARCCNPVPGDEIIGFVTRGRGVCVHRTNCPNATELLSSPERIIEVEWDSGSKATYQVEIFVEALDRLRLLQDVTMAIAESGVNILSSSTTTHRDGLVDMRFLFEIGEMGRLDALLRDVRRVDGVFEARRMLPGETRRRRRARTQMHIVRVQVGPLQSNCWVVSDGKGPAVVVDPGGDLDRILEAVGDSEVAAIVLTHCHFDHLGAAAGLVDATGAPLMAHSADAEFVSTAEGTGGALFGFHGSTAPPPNRMLEDGDEVTAGTMSMEILYTPGHTPGGICLLATSPDDDRAHLFSGDTVFAGSVGRTDFPRGDGRALSSSIASKIAPLPADTVIHPGHGPDSTIGREARINPFWPRA